MLRSERLQRSTPHNSRSGFSIGSCPPELPIFWPTSTDNIGPLDVPTAYSFVLVSSAAASPTIAAAVVCADQELHQVLLDTARMAGVPPAVADDRSTVSINGLQEAIG